MNEDIIVTDREVQNYKKQLEKIAISGGYFLNPDNEYTDELIKGLLKNLKRYGYEACPCRLAKNDKQKDLDIICPCYYRDDDVSEFGTCYCGLYVSKEVFEKKLPVSSIPERRPVEQNTIKSSKEISNQNLSLSYNVWRCNVCGYLCARDNPPDVCPICKAKKERFEIFIKAK